MRDLIETAQEAEIILLPKGDNCRPAIDAFSDATGIEVPIFGYREYRVKAAGKTFYSVSAKDIASFVDQGLGDIGLTGLDQYYERQQSYSTALQFQKIGGPMCYMALLAPVGRTETVLSRVYPRRQNGWTAPARVATSFPAIVSAYAATQDANMVVGTIAMGSTEVIPQLSGDDVAVDIVTNGKTASANGLEVAQTLFDVYPVIIAKARS